MLQLCARMRVSFIVKVAIALALFAFGGVAQSQDRMIVAGYTEFAPYMFTDKSGQPTGFSVELLRDAAAANDFDIEFQRFESVGALTESLAAGNIDVTVLLGVTEARQSLGTFSHAMGSWSFEVLFADHTPEHVLNGDLRGLRIAVSEGSAPHRFLESYDGVEFFYSGSVAERLFALFNGSIDAVAGPPSVFQAAAKDVGLAARLSPHTLLLAETPRAFLVSNDQPVFLANLNLHIDRLNATGRIEQFEEAWLARLSPNLAERLGAHALTYLGFCLVLILLLAGLLAITSLKRKVDAADKLRTQSMLEALDAAQAGIVVFDPEGRLQASNLAFDNAFPGLSPLMNEHAKAETFFQCAHEQGYFGHDPRGYTTAMTLAGMVAEDGSQAAELMLYGASGRVYACLACRLTDARLALVATDVSDLEENNRAIEAKAGALRAANKQLATFAHVAAHDLKSPAASAATLLDWIADDLNDAGIEIPETVNEAIDRARGLLRRQVALIEDLLAYARTTSTKSAAQIIRPNERLSTIMALIDLPDGFSIEFEEDLPAVLADPAAFDLVVRNLLNNAIKHHDRPNGTIVLRSEPEAEAQIAFVIEDDGPGIEDRYAERVFEPFFRLATHDDTAGSGLGLSVIQNAVQAWGGTVSLSSRSPRGTAIRFTVVLADRAADRCAPDDGGFGLSEQVADATNLAR